MSWREENNIKTRSQRLQGREEKQEVLAVVCSTLCRLIGYKGCNSGVSPRHGEL